MTLLLIRLAKVTKFMVSNKMETRRTYPADMKSKQGEVVDMEPHACLPIISFKAIFKIVITGEKWDTVSIT